MKHYGRRIFSRDPTGVLTRSTSWSYLPAFQNPATSIADDHCAPLSGAFSIPYVMALAALGRTAGPQWYSTENPNDSVVWNLARKISTQPDKTADDEVRQGIKSKIGRFRKTPASLRVYAKGKEFFRSTEYVKGDPWSADTVAKWSDVERKFHDFCGGIIPSEQMDQLIKQFRNLEKIPNVSHGLTLR